MQWHLKLLKLAGSFGRVRVYFLYLFILNIFYLFIFFHHNDYQNFFIVDLGTILHRWKRNWFVLYLDGTLRFFENPDSHTAEEAHSIHGHCIRILTGDQVVDVTPPDGGYSRSCLLRIEFRESTLTLCAESKDDMKYVSFCFDSCCKTMIFLIQVCMLMIFQSYLNYFCCRAWQVALEQARVAQVGSRPRSAPPPYSCNGAPPAYAPPPYDYYQNDQAGYYPGHQTMYAGQQLPAGYCTLPCC